ncbi:3940_t:CDS:2, partial [Cetraspora pellucida]
GMNLSSIKKKNFSIMTAEIMVAAAPVPPVALVPPEVFAGTLAGETGLAGALTGSVMAFVNTPVELLKVQLQTQKNQKPPVPNPYRGVFDIAVRIYATNGITGLYHGLPITIIRDIPSFATYFFAYEGIKKIIGNYNHNGNKNQLTTPELLFAGGMAGIACWIPCYPQDVIK